MLTFLQGISLQCGLVLALGAQNLFVLECGLQRRHPVKVALVCTICDWLLIGLGVLGAAEVMSRAPLLKVGIGLLGTGFLAVYAMTKVRDALRPAGQLAAPTLPTTASAMVWAALGFSLLNPHVYLDTVVLVGGYAARFPTVTERLFFGLGASVISTVWFFGLSLTARALAPVLNNPRAMRRVAWVSAMLLAGLSFRLGGEVWSWMGPPPAPLQNVADDFVKRPAA